MHRIYLKNRSSQSYWVCDIVDGKKIAKISKKGKIKLKKGINSAGLIDEINFALKQTQQAWKKHYYNYLKTYNQQYSDLKNYKFPAFAPALRLKKCPKDIYQRKVYLHPKARKAWLKMQKAAAQEGIKLQIVSAYRSLSYQKQLIENKRKQGQTLSQILRVNTLPGFSQHHTGCAIDITANNAAVLTAEFDQSQAFVWLQKHGKNYGFSMTYPQNNTTGICYEPWHWYYSKTKN